MPVVVGLCRQRKLAAVKVKKEDMNRLIMNFLITEVGSLPGQLLLPAPARRALMCKLASQLHPRCLAQGDVGRPICVGPAGVCGCSAGL